MNNKSSLPSRQRSTGAAILTDEREGHSSESSHVAVLACCLQIALVPCIALAASENRPNVILMMADDLGWGDVGFNGNQIIQTPNLDAMAAAGLRLNRFYAAAPVCSPTRGSCLTGRHPYRFGILSANQGHMLPEEVTLAELLGQLGYATGHFGKWHLGTLTTTIRDSNRGGPRGAVHFSTPPGNGFHVCFSTEAKVPTWDPMWKPKQAGNRWWQPTAREFAVPYGTRYWDQNGDVVTKNLDGDDSRVIMDRAIPFLRNAVRSGKPFFAVIWFHAPHLPVVAGPDHTKLYNEHPDYARHYFGCITALDEQIGRLRAALRTLGVADNTLITFCSDNGPEGVARSAPGSAGPFRGRKRSLYEGGVRVPGIIEWPARIKPGRLTSFPAVTSDYLPTIAEVVGVSPLSSRPLDGISLLPLIDGDDRQTRGKPIGFQSRDMQVWMTDRYKLVRKLPGKNKRGTPQAAAADPSITWELYDLLDDPSEANDLAEQLPERLNSMRQQLADWISSCAESARLPIE